jgi:rhamnosyltransferase
MKTCLCIPTYNADKYAVDLFSAVKNQYVQPDRIVVIDSSSTDDTVKISESYGADVYNINKYEFNHGVTRQKAVEIASECDFIIFLTQDSIPAHKDTFHNLLKYFENDEVAAIYGRQLPANGASTIEQHARLFNYPPLSQIRSIQDVKRLGIRTAFFSDACSAYRRDALIKVGGFPHTIFGEDTCVAAKLILAGYKIAYSANAEVFHSHNYPLIEEFKRYFDIGVFHARNPWLINSFGKAEGEGKRFIKSQLIFLVHEYPLLIPMAMLRNVLKLLAYRFGLVEAKLPHQIKKKLSLNKNFWEPLY